MKNIKLDEKLITDYKKENWMTPIIRYPERILPITFFLLCMLGGILLFFPISTTKAVSFVDALFTAVSAVCVTGLVVLDTGKDFTGFGQFIVIFLIQTGGLGIMSFTSIIFILLGRRMSLFQEKTVRTIFDAESKDEIAKSLKLIFKYTFFVELMGAIILTCCFMFTESSFLEALKNGFFTSISAFCNAGFSLKTGNLVGYQQNPIVLVTVSLLIIFGGIAPAISVMLPNIFKGKKLPPMALLIFNTTLFLLVFGTLIFYISEFNGALAHLNIFDKLSNSWFQSASARTAGFNSVDLGHLNPGSFLAMVFLMIAGGSPGGTAGGIKTVTLGILFLTLCNTFRGKCNIVSNRQINQLTLQKALSLTMFYLFILTISIVTLIITQSISPTWLVFESASALGTVGLSMGATSHLNEVGKVIIIATMFLGRVAPATFLFHINAKNQDARISYPDAKISLT